MKIVSDNTTTLNIFDDLGLSLEKVDLSKKKIIFNLKKIKITKFYLKTIILLLFVKLVGKPVVVKKEKEFFVSIYPNYFSYGKKKFF